MRCKSPYLIPLLLLAVWRPLPPLPEPKEQFGMEACGDAIYAVAGIDGNLAEANSVYAYDGSAWRRCRAYPLPVQSLTLECLAGRLYGVGGYDHRNPQGGKTANVYAYDAARDEWLARAMLHVAREDHGSAVLAGRLLVFGGVTNPDHALTATMEVYDPNRDAWTLFPWPQPRALGDFAAASDGRLEICTGVHTLDEYPRLTGRAYVDLAVWRGGVVLCGGSLAGTGDVTSRVDVIGADPLSPLPYPARGMGTAVWRDRLYVCGGFDGQKVRSDFLVWEP